jgi:hypothetical protein
MRDESGFVSAWKVVENFLVINLLRRLRENFWGNFSSFGLETEREGGGRGNWKSLGEFMM